MLYLLINYYIWYIYANFFIYKIIYDNHETILETELETELISEKLSEA
jgi:hypothetical protein